MPSYKPVFPQLIDASQVDTGLGPRPIGTTTDESRIETAKSTGGTPLVEYEGNANPYIDYQSIDMLLSLQHPRSQGYDEMCFFVMGQTKVLSGAMGDPQRDVRGLVRNSITAGKPSKHCHGG